MSTKISREEYYKEAKNLIEGNGGKLLSTKYENATTKLNFLCSCGSNYNLTLIKLRASRGFCPLCRYDRAIKCKYTLSSVRQIFKNNGCLLLSTEYKSHMPLLFECACGNHESKELQVFLKLPKCSECAKKERLSRSLERRYKKMQDFFKSNGCILITKKENYKGGISRVKFACSCGSVGEKGIDNFRIRPKCSLCVKQDRANRMKEEYPRIKCFIDENNCVLLTKVNNYVNNKTILDVQCSCGELFKISFTRFKHENKRTCNKCSLKRTSGKNCSLWKGGTSSERDIDRNSDKYKIWRKAVFKRDVYTCQICGDNSGGNLCAHHIENYSEHPELRYDVSNGITLCNDCHNPSKYASFHHRYGSRNNNKQQLDEYIEIYNMGGFDVARLANLINKYNLNNKEGENNGIKEATGERGN